MESDFSDIIVSMLRQAEPDLDARLEYQAEALQEAACTEPLLGQWIETHHVQYLLSAFALSDSDFAENFPKMAHVNEHQRKRIINAFEDHFEHCRRCSLKRGYDLELDSRIERTLRKNREDLIHHLKPADPKTSSDADHLDLLEPVPQG